MTRAVRLADRNKQLEHELHDIDRIAVAVEAECNSTVKENSKRVLRIQVLLLFLRIIHHSNSTDHTFIEKCKAFNNNNNNETISMLDFKIYSVKVLIFLKK